jgi:ribose transport system permease protein
MKRKLKSFGIRLRQTQELSILILIILFVLFLYLLDRKFFEIGNIQTILKGFVPYFIMGCGMTYVIIMKQLDLSVGSVAGLTSIIVGYLLTNQIPVVVSILLAICIGIIIGSINGFLVSYLKWPSIMVTLGMMYIVMGVSLILLKGSYLHGFPQYFKAIGQMPIILITPLIIGIFFFIVLSYTKFGYSINSIGGNEDAAIAVGIRVKRIKFIGFILCGTCSSIVGVLMSSTLNVSSYQIVSGYELYVIAAVIIGGTSLYGGIGSILGTLLGAFFLILIKRGLLLSGIDPYWQFLLIGIILLIAVGIDTYRRNKMWKIAR